VEASAAAGPIQTEQSEIASNRVGRAKPAADEQIVSNIPSLPMNGRNMLEVQALSPSKTAPHWTIAANGALQRSFDGGTTWQDVNVTGEDSTTAVLTAQAKVAESAKAVKKSEAQKPTLAAASPALRALAANGAEVWAGGSGGALYHTVDAGNSWARVVPSYEGIVLGGDIIGVEFPDPQHGRVSTSTGEVWTTGDGGRSWMKTQ
jgi:photosystem II stability/assembly factor-like uncharacterized protein